MHTLDTLHHRRSSRAFLDQPVGTETVTALLDAARWTPSGGNLQPWEVAVVQGGAKARISQAILAARADGTPENPDYHYYPTQWHEPFLGRRRVCGMALYKALGITREDNVARRESWNNNYRFFGAPVALFFFLDRTLGQGAWLDLGMFMQSVMLAATDQGLATCPLASVADYPDLVRRELGRDDSAILIGGMALGYADPEAPVNGYRTERAPLEAFTRFYS